MIKAAKIFPGFRLILLVTLVAACYSCEDEEKIQGPAVEFVVHYDSEVAAAVEQFQIYATASDDGGNYCDYYQPWPKGSDELDGESVVVHKGLERFIVAAAVRIEGYNASGNLVISRQALRPFPEEGVATMDINLDSTCLNVSCEEGDMNYNRQCVNGDCQNTTAAAGVFMEGGPIEEETYCSVPE